MQIQTRRSVLALAMAALVCLLAGALALPADAKKKTRSKKAEGKLVAYDAEAKTITLKVKGKKEVYQVKPEGSVLTRTTVTINARPAKLGELPEGAPLIVYWIRDETDPKKRFARKIDAPKIPKELLEAFED